MPFKDYDLDCHQRFEPACRAVMTRILTLREHAILDGEDAVRAVLARMSPRDRAEYSPKRGPNLDLYVTDIVARATGGEIFMYELEARWRDEDGRSHFAELHSYHFGGDGYSTVHVPQRKVVHGNVSDFYIGFSPMLDGLYLIRMDDIRRYNDSGHVVYIRARAHGRRTEREPMVDVPNTPELVKFMRIGPDSGPKSVGLRFDAAEDRWIVPGGR